MSPILFAAIRLLMLPVLTGTGFIAYGEGLEWFAKVIPIPQDRSLMFGALLAQGFAAAALVSILFCYPLAFIYGKSAMAIAFIMALPVLAFRLPELVNVDRHPIALAISAYEVLAYSVLLLAGTGAACGHLMRAGDAGKPDQPQALRRLP